MLEAAYRAAVKSQEYYQLPQHSSFHHAVSLVTSQRVSFSAGRRARQRLCELLGNQEFTPEGVAALTDRQLESVGNVALIRALGTAAERGDFTVQALSALRGIGPWTIKAFKLLEGTANVKDDKGTEDFFLAEDAYIRRRITELTGESLTTASCRRLAATAWPGNQRLMSLFFWRIRPDGIRAIRDNTPLYRKHFL